MSYICFLCLTVLSGNAFNILRHPLTHHSPPRTMGKTMSCSSLRHINSRYLPFLFLIFSFAVFFFLLLLGYFLLYFYVQASRVRHVLMADVIDFLPYGGSCAGIVITSSDCSSFPAVLHTFEQTWTTTTLCVSVGVEIKA